MAYRNLMIAAMASGVTLMPVASQAACTLGDLKGNWQVYAPIQDGGWTNSMRCTLTADGAGRITAGTCTNDAGQTGKMTAGKFTLANAKTCTFMAQYKLGGVTDRVIEATMAKNKNFVGGVGVYATGTFVVNMTRLPEE